LQEVFTQVSNEWVDKHGQAWDQADEEGMAFITKLEREVIKLSEEEKQQWQDAVKPILDEYITKTAEQALPGKEFLADVKSLIEELSTKAE